MRRRLVGPLPTARTMAWRPLGRRLQRIRRYRISGSGLAVGRVACRGRCRRCRLARMLQPVATGSMGASCGQRLQPDDCNRLGQRPNGRCFARYSRNAQHTNPMRPRTRKRPSEWPAAYSNLRKRTSLSKQNLRDSEFRRLIPPSGGFWKYAESSQGAHTLGDTTPPRQSEVHSKSDSLDPEKSFNHALANARPGAGRSRRLYWSRLPRTVSPTELAGVCDQLRRRRQRAPFRWGRFLGDAILLFRRLKRRFAVTASVSRGGRLVVSERPH